MDVDFSFEVGLMLYFFFCICILPVWRTALKQQEIDEFVRVKSAATHDRTLRNFREKLTS